VIDPVPNLWKRILVRIPFSDLGPSAIKPLWSSHQRFSPVAVQTSHSFQFRWHISWNHLSSIACEHRRIISGSDMSEGYLASSYSYCHRWVHSYGAVFG